MDGILNICKPAGPTSHDMVARVRRLARTRRVGHAGTLDPPAEGVLVLFLGIATRLIEFTADADKEYVAEVLFGAATTTLDATGEVTATADASALTREQVLAALPHFTGDILQVPPMYSARHHQGQRLYELARRGEEVTREARPVTIHALELQEFTPGAQARARVRVVCSKGTYVRTLCADLGDFLGVPAHMAALTRTRVGAFRIEDAVSLEDLQAPAGEEEEDSTARVRRALLPAGMAVAHLPRVVLSDDTLVRVLHGNAVPVMEAEGAGVVRLETEAGLLVAVAERRYDAARGWYVQPTKVLRAEAA